MQEQIIQLQKEVRDLKYIVDLFVRPDRYLFAKDVKFTGRKIGFYSKEPVVQPSGVGVTDQYIHASTAVSASDRFGNGAGGTPYTISDIVKALQQVGILAP